MTLGTIVTEGFMPITLDLGCRAEIAAFPKVLAVVVVVVVAAAATAAAVGSVVRRRRRSSFASCWLCWHW